MSNTIDTNNRILCEHATLPADSELPVAAQPPQLEDAVPRPEVAGGLDNIPEALIPDSQAAADELDHSGLDVVLPDEDEAPAGAESKCAEKWGPL